MATAILDMSGFHLDYPTHGRLQIRRITRATTPSGSSYTLGDNSLGLHFNPSFHLSSPGRAFSFFWTTLAAMDSEIILRIATFAFNHVRSANWLCGLSLSVHLETVYELEEPRRGRSADFLDDHMIFDTDVVVGRDNFVSIQPFASTTGVDYGNEGTSEQEISMLKTERVSDDDKEECCSICLEGFMRGMLITQLAPCSHRFHKACIVQWLQKKPTCPNCRSTCTRSVS